MSKPLKTDITIIIAIEPTAIDNMVTILKMFIALLFFFRKIYLIAKKNGTFRRLIKIRFIFNYEYFLNISIVLEKSIGCGAST